MEVKCNVWMSKWQRLNEIIKGEESPHIIGSDCDLSNDSDYTKIGTAVAHVTLHSQEQIVQDQITAAQAELAKVRAENQKRENAILDRISKLQALTFEPA